MTKYAIIGSIGSTAVIIVILGSLFSFLPIVKGTNAAAALAETSANTTTTPSSNSISTIEKLNVVTSVAPLANIIKNIGGDRIQLMQLIPDGVDSHTFELTPSGAIKVRNADLVIINGLRLESGVERVSNASRTDHPQQQLLKLADNTITPSQWAFDFSFPRENGDPNPHLWLNVANAMNYAKLVSAKLIQMDPQNAAYYSSNTERYLSVLKRLDDGIMKSVQTIAPENRKLLTYHDSWAYFAPHYGMTVIGAVQPSDFGEPAPQGVAKLIDQIRTVHVPAIFGSEVFPSKVIDQIGREANVKFVTALADDSLPGKPGDPQHSYVGMILQDMHNMIVPLGGNVAALDGIDPKDTFTP